MRRGEKVQDTASLHEKAVQAIATGEVAPMSKKPRKKPERRVQPTYASPLVDERVWEVAKKILEGPGGYTRWEIPDENTVVVR